MDNRRDGCVGPGRCVHAVPGIRRDREEYDSNYDKEKAPEHSVVRFFVGHSPEWDMLCGAGDDIAILFKTTWGLGILIGYETDPGLPLQALHRWTVGTTRGSMHE